MSEPTYTDHNYLSIITTIILLVISIIGIMLRGWFKHVNTNLDKLWTRLDTEAESRATRWNNLHEKCELHTARISKLEGRLDGKAKVLSALDRVNKEDL